MEFIQTIGESINWNVVTAMAMAIGLVSYLRFVAPKIQKRKELYQEVVLVLTVVGAVYEDETVKEVTSFIKDVVEDLAELDVNIDETEVHDMVKTNLASLGFELDEDVLAVIVKTVVYYLG